MTVGGWTPLFTRLLKPDHLLSEIFRCVTRRLIQRLGLAEAVVEWLYMSYASS